MPANNETPETQRSAPVLSDPIVELIEKCIQGGCRRIVLVCGPMPAQEEVRPIEAVLYVENYAQHRPQVKH